MPACAPRPRRAILQRCAISLICRTCWRGCMVRRRSRGFGRPAPYRIFRSSAWSIMPAQSIGCGHGSARAMAIFRRIGSPASWPGWTMSRVMSMRLPDGSRRCVSGPMWRSATTGWHTQRRWQRALARWRIGCPMQCTEPCASASWIGEPRPCCGELETRMRFWQWTWTVRAM